MEELMIKAESMLKEYSEQKSTEIRMNPDRYNGK